MFISSISLTLMRLLDYPDSSLREEHDLVLLIIVDI